MTILLFILGVVVFFISTAVSLAYLYVKEDESDDWPFGVCRWRYVYRLVLMRSGCIHVYC